jgi:hypothetical protein
MITPRLRTNDNEIMIMKYDAMINHTQIREFMKKSLKKLPV